MISRSRMASFKRFDGMLCATLTSQLTANKRRIREPEPAGDANGNWLSPRKAWELVVDATLTPISQAEGPRRPAARERTVLAKITTRLLPLITNLLARYLQDFRNGSGLTDTSAE